MWIGKKSKCPFMIFQRLCRKEMLKVVEQEERMKNVIRSIRKGSAQWNEEDRLKIATLLLKAGYSVRIGRQQIPDSGNKKQMEYTVEYWEE